jgi:hypothetical protein
MGRLGRGPTRSDGPGYIYVYRIEGKDAEGNYKVGRTIRAVEKRISEWPGAILMYQRQTRYNILSESLIHILLGHYRMHHCADCGKFWPASQKVPPLCIEGRRAHRHRQIEWFKRPLPNIEKVVDDVVDYVNTVEPASRRPAHPAPRPATACAGD